METRVNEKVPEAQFRDYLPIIGGMFRFYWSYVMAAGRRLPPELAFGKILPPRQEHAGKLTLDASYALDFTRDYERLEEVTRKAGSLSLDYKTMLYGSHAIRLLTCVAAFLAPRWALCVAALQFVLAPLSLPISIMFMMVNIPEYITHYIFAFAVGPAIGGHGLVFTIGYRFVGLLLIFDQASSWFYYLRDSEPFGFLRLMRHVVYGTFTTRSVNVVVFGLLWGFQVDVVVLVLASVLSNEFNKRFLGDVLQMLGLPGHDVRYYIQHRVAHLPVVYAHAHKMHHHLHDTGPWDAQFFGSAINEVFFVMLVDVLPCLLAPSLWIVPSCFNAYTMYLTLIDKGEHTRSKAQSKGYDAENWHADHHTLHIKNFAVPDGALLDFYFCTQGPSNKGTLGMRFSREVEESNGGVGKKIIVDIAVANKKIS
mmetsp:Transcript_59126/g.108703  ORF Transcript_59126/g.108703 Transcript_59126/m.108703 type:complete len:424 (+) Transcript_59126:45-1316(+)